MTYLKSYVLAVVSVLAPLGIFYTVSDAVQGRSIALYFLFLGLAGGIGGPMRMWIEGRQRKLQKAAACVAKAPQD
jgi:hypothetical protein